MSQYRPWSLVFRQLRRWGLKQLSEHQAIGQLLQWGHAQRASQALTRLQARVEHLQRQTPDLIRQVDDLTRRLADLRQRVEALESRRRRRGRGNSGSG